MGASSDGMVAVIKIRLAFKCALATWGSIEPIGLCVQTDFVFSQLEQRTFAPRQFKYSIIRRYAPREKMNHQSRRAMNNLVGKEGPLSQSEEG
jgi:hypothetical protein